MLPAASAQPHREPQKTSPVTWLRKFPPLSKRAQHLLIHGDTDNRYTSRNTADTGYRTTMALAVACSQPGRTWTPADLYEVLVHRPTPAGTWARHLRARKGTDYTTTKLADMLERAREFVGHRPVIEDRTDAIVDLTRLRDTIEDHPWKGRTGGTDQKNLTARLRLAELAGGCDHTVSVRHLAELMGCAKSTAVSSNQRLVNGGFLKLLQAGKNTEASLWQLTFPTTASTRAPRASPAHPPTARERGAGSVPETRRLHSLMAHDAFHAWAHGTSGARLLATLDQTDGTTTRQLALATGLHPSTVRRRMSALVKDNLARQTEGLYYLVHHVHTREETHILTTAAINQGTSGHGAKRQLRHARDRDQYAKWRAHRAENRHADRARLKLVPEGTVNPETGELTDLRWQGWDVSDPAHPTWADDRLSQQASAA
ncbi:winged helix-turn-helix domain-containing protein [Streptomyces sp. NPDC101150]|uniref:winged helix-turn-helix domain-containing protein n=1 Tax=Streptomyces sp. NPDC101150 TaxID=3366114 RepID=UPI0038300B73